MQEKIFGSLLLALLTGCSGGGDLRLDALMKQREDNREKKGTMVNLGKPFPDGMGDGAGGTSRESDGADSSGDDDDGDGAAAVDAQGNTISRISFYCSEDTSKTIGRTIHTVSGVSFKLFDSSSGALVAEDKEAARAQARVASLRSSGTAEIDLSFSARYQNLAGTYYLALCDLSGHDSCTIPVDRRSNPLDKDDGKYSTNVVGYVNNVVVANNAITSVGKGEVLLDIPKTPAEEEQCAQVDSPLIVDLAGDGFAFSSLSNGVSFDIDGNGKANKTAWPVDTDDAFLALDLNDNGLIDGGQELFGNHSIGPDGKKSANGFLSLAKYDENGDGKIDARDAVFNKLILWSDHNRDGASDVRELTSLSSAGLRAISLDYLEVVERDRHGNEIRQRALVHFADHDRVIVDIWLKRL